MNNEDNTILAKWLEDKLDKTEVEQISQQYDLTQLSQNLHILEKLEIQHQNHVEQSWENFTLLKDKQKPKSKYWNWLWPVLVLTIIGWTSKEVMTYINNNKEEIIESKVGQDVAGILPDGSNYHLNALSSIQLKPKLWSQQRVLKLKGQASFKVVKGSAFDVITDYGTVTVIGTQFDVSCYGEFMTVSCFEGKVKVIGLNQKIYHLEAHQKMQLGNGYASDIFRENMTSSDWVDKVLTFDNISLEEVLAELKKYYDVKFEIQKIHKTKRFSGHVPTNDLKKALDFIFIPLGIDYKHSGNSVVL
jgi:transmembrane sensor